MKVLTKILVLFSLQLFLITAYEVPDVTNGLNDQGEHVCYFDDQISKSVQEAYQQQTLTTVTKETCCWQLFKCWKWCNVTKLASRSFMTYRLTTKYYDRRNYHCCSGWDKVNSTSTGCQKAVCNIDCRHGGECIQPDTCKCKQGFEGNYCQIETNECDDVNKNFCEQTCIDMRGGIKCACKRGYQLNQDAKTCSDINECNEDSPPCRCTTQDQCNVTCINTPGSFQCQCGGGFQLNSAGVCEDINECLLTIKPPCDHKCVNTIGSYKCLCQPGYEVVGGKCQDIDECMSNNGGCSDTCHNLNGTHICSCPDKFFLDKDQRTCKAINNTSYKRAIICESDQLGYLDCEHLDEQLLVISTMYGRLSTDVCKQGNYSNNTRCSADVPSTHLQHCNGQSSCVFFFHDLQDPCPGVEKYFDITYDCLKKV